MPLYAMHVPKLVIVEGICICSSKKPETKCIFMHIFFKLWMLINTYFTTYNSVTIIIFFLEKLMYIYIFESDDNSNYHESKTKLICFEFSSDITIYYDLCNSNYSHKCRFEYQINGIVLKNS